MGLPAVPRWTCPFCKSDPGKQQPQLKNLAHGAHIAASDLRVLLRTLGEE